MESCKTTLGLLGAFLCILIIQLRAPDHAKLQRVYVPPMRAHRVAEHKFRCPRRDMVLPGFGGCCFVAVDAA
ncbi:hypothetical protein M433DRAFT_157653 [Acidomyces richmondensis BFW]|nr:MAG: hypothetical protein FE78DRAFT_84186 [Acidomyces sp. 'richmondensis']KYG42649.1 hypothetical protein M433DRAFT_157653 [Acidomyces richmondensis BFW]